MPNQPMIHGSNFGTIAPNTWQSLTLISQHGQITLYRNGARIDPAIDDHAGSGVGRPNDHARSNRGGPGSHAEEA